MYSRYSSYGTGRRSLFAEMGISPAVKWLIVANVVAFIVQAFLFRAVAAGSAGAESVIWNLMLHGRDLFVHFRVWQLVTYMFLHGGIGHLFFNMLMLWMFGTSVEKSLGTRRFLWLYFLSGVFGGLCQALVDLTAPSLGIIGASGGVFGIMVAFGMLFGEAMVLVFFFFPMKAKHMALVFVGMNVMILVTGQQGVAALAHLGGAGAAWLFIRFNLFARRGRVHGGSRSSSISARIRTVIRGVFVTDDSPSANTAPRRNDNYDSGSSAELEREEREVDEILAKIGREGIASLTQPERDVLERASRRKRRQQRQ